MPLIRCHRIQLSFRPHGLACIHREVPLSSTYVNPTLCVCNERLPSNHLHHAHYCTCELVMCTSTRRKDKKSLTRISCITRRRRDTDVHWSFPVARQSSTQSRRRPSLEKASLTMIRAKGIQKEVGNATEMRREMNGMGATPFTSSTTRSLGSLFSSCGRSAVPASRIVCKL